MPPLRIWERTRIFVTRILGRRGSTVEGSSSLSTHRGQLVRVEGFSAHHEWKAEEHDSGGPAIVGCVPWENAGGWASIG